MRWEKGGEKRKKRIKEGGMREKEWGVEYIYSDYLNLEGGGRGGRGRVTAQLQHETCLLPP